MKLSEFRDELIIEEAVARLKSRVKKCSGIDFNFGDLVFTLHDGVCKKIEFGVEGRCFIKKPVLIPGGA